MPQNSISVDSSVVGWLMARLRYLAVPEQLPPADDLHAQADYWKRHYNTFLGAGTVEKYLKAYRLHVGDVS